MKPLIFTQATKLLFLFLVIGCLCSFKTTAQENAAVTGVVQTEQGEPINGATVIAKNNKTNFSTGTQSDATGTFRFSRLPAGPYTFTISYVSFETQIIGGYTITGNAPVTLSIKLKEAAASLNQVVVVGYGAQRKKDLTGSIASVRTADVKGQSVASADQMLQGRVGGINVTNASGMPGAGVRVSVRGIGSINGSNEPLYVIDGIPVNNGDPSPFTAANKSGFGGGGILNPLSAINPNDIESIDVLKDAAAASIYGSRATNGVVIITTKRGRDGKTDVELNSYYGIQSLPKTIHLASTELYFQVLNEAINNFNKQKNFTPGSAGYLASVADPRTVKEPDTDWVGLLTDKNAPVMNHDLSIRGGNNKTRFYASFNYFDQDGVIKTNEFKRMGSRLNLDHKVSDKIDLGFAIGLSTTTNNRVPNDAVGNAILMRALEQRPYDKPYKADGTYTIGGVDILRHNGVAVLNEQKSDDKTYKAIATVNATVKLIDGLQYKPSVSVDITQFQNYLYNNKNHPYGRPLGAVFDYRNLAKNYLVENILTYTKKFSDLDLTALAGHSFQKFIADESYIDGRDFPSPAFGYISSAGRINQAYTNWTSFALESYLSRVNLTYLDKYLLTVAVRRDGSSRFAQNKKYGTFPSASIAWRLAEEPFFKDVKWLNNLKLRLSYGLTGNQEGIGNFASFPLTTGGENYNQQIGIAVTQPGNANLQWEKANQTNIGIDADILKNRVNITADYFIKNTNELLFDLPVQATTGFTTQTKNIGAIKNTGVELAFNSRNMTGEFKWSTSFNISFIKNQITRLADDKPIPFSFYHLIQVGQSVGTFYMLKQEGIYQDDKEIPSALFAKGVRAGDVKFRDVNGDGDITAADRMVVGKATPDYFGGLTNTFSYKNFDLVAFMQFSEGNKVFSFWRGNNFGDGIDGVGGNQFAMLKETVEQRWKGPGTSNEVPRAIWPTANGNYNKQISTRFLEDGSFFRLKTLSLGYTFPQLVVRNLRLNSIRIYVSAQNLWTASKYKGYDPEVSYSIDPRQMGIDAATVPQPRSFLFGLNVKF